VLFIAIIFSTFLFLGFVNLPRFISIVPNDAFTISFIFDILAEALSNQFHIFALDVSSHFKRMIFDL